MYHGSPFSGINFDFSNFKGPAFFTLDEEVAIQYAKNQTLLTGNNVANEEKAPRVYLVDILPEVLAFDSRKPADRSLAKMLFEDAWNEKVRSSGLPTYAFLWKLKKELPKHGFNGAWIDEGTQGISLVVWKPAGLIHVMLEYTV